MPPDIPEHMPDLRALEAPNRHPLDRGDDGMSGYRPRAAAAPKQSRIRLIPFDEIEMGTAPRYLVKGLIPRVGLTVVWGPPKSGKSFWTFDVMMHVALGWEYRGRRVMQGPVVYCAFEGQTGVEARVEAFRQRKLSEHAEGAAFYLQPVTLDLVGDHVELIATIRRQLDRTPPVAVVLDTLNRSLRGSESNDQDMTAYIKAADAIREAFSCAVVVVHHCGIDGSRPRGHTSLTGAVDAQLAVKRNGADNIIVECELSKDGPQGDTLASRLEVVDVGQDEDGDMITSCVIVEAEASHSKKSSRIPQSARIALDSLRQALSEAGEPAPGSVTKMNVTLGTKVVSTDLWRKYCYASTVTDSVKPDAKRQAFNRASAKLLEIKAIGIWNDYVWTINQDA